MAGIASETAPAARKDKAGRSPLVFPPAVVVVASVLAAAGIAVAGLLSEISLGDENLHLRQAQVYAQQGKRVPYDTSHGLGVINVKPLWAVPLWHAGLALLGKVSGIGWHTLAQIYQAAFYLALVLGVYFGCRQIWDASAASWAWLIVTTMPMVCAYSIVLYQDVPGLAVAAWGIFFLWRRNYFATGCCLAAAYLIKLNMLSFAPWAVVFAACRSEGRWKQRLAATFLVAAPIMAAVGYDVLWRFSQWGDFMVPGPKLPPAIASLLAAKPSQFQYWNVDPIFDPRPVVRNIGILGLAAMPLALVYARDTASRWMWAAVAVAAAGYTYIFLLSRGIGWAQIRYAFPVIILWAFLSGRGLAGFRLSPAMRWGIIGVSVIIAAAACGYVVQKRQIPEVEKAAYTWIRENTPSGSVILCPEEVIENQTDRYRIWCNPTYLMSEATDEECKALLAYYQVSYIAVPKRRIYDREKEGIHDGGYARDFIHKLDTLPYIIKVYENDGYIIYEVGPRKTRPRTGAAERAGDSICGSCA